MFIGQSHVTLDNKGKLELPAQYHQAVRAGAYLTMGFDQNLLLLSSEAFQNILVYIRSLSITDPTARLFTRLFLGNAVELSLEENGQVIVPMNLLKHAGISGEVVIVGQGEYGELWAPGFWATQSKEFCDHEANPGRFSGLQIAMV